MKKFAAFVLIMVIGFVFITGCGKITSNSLDIGTGDSVSQQGSAGPAEYVQGMKGFLDSYVASMGDERELQSAETAPQLAAFEAKSFKASGLDLDKDYQYWNYLEGSSNIGKLVERIEAKYRYIDKRTGLPFQKFPKQFTASDSANIDYIERPILFTAYYPDYYPERQVYQLYAREKIIPNGNDKTTFTILGDDSRFTYIGVPWDELKITEREIIHNHNTGVAEGYMNIIGLKNPDFSARFQLIFDNGLSGYDAEVFWAKRKMVDIRINKNLGVLTTFYYIGKDSKYFYDTLSSTNGGYEDNSIIQLVDSAMYNETVDIDGVKQYILGKRLQNFSLKAINGSSPKVRRLTLRSIDTLEVDSSVFYPQGVRIIDCSDVTVFGEYHSYIKDQTFRK